MSDFVTSSAGITYPLTGIEIIQAYLADPSGITQAELNKALSEVVIYLVQASVVLPSTSSS